MSIRTRKEKWIAVKRWIVFIIIVCGVCWGGHKFFGWGNKIISHISSKTSEVVPDTNDVIHDTLFIPDVSYKDSIQLEYKEGHHYVTVNIDGIKIKGLLDSGCSSGICGCSIDYAFLKRHGYIKNSTRGESIIANGDTISNIICTVYNVTIGHIKLDSVMCSFMDSQTSMVLIGQDILKQLGAYVIDYNNHVMYIKN